MHSMEVVQDICIKEKEMKLYLVLISLAFLLGEVYR